MAMDCDKLRDLLSDPQRLSEAKQRIAGKSDWYHQSYPAILRVFAQTAVPTLEDQVIRNLLVSAWVAKILKPQPEQQMLDCYLDAAADVRQQTTVEKIDIGTLRKIRSAGNRLLNSGSGPNIATVSKLLHFDMPRAFPILDGRVAERIGISNMNTKSYSAYIDCLGAIRIDNPNTWTTVEDLAQSLGVPPLRVVDTCLF